MGYMTGKDIFGIYVINIFGADGRVQILVSYYTIICEGEFVLLHRTF